MIRANGSACSLSLCACRYTNNRACLTSTYVFSQATFVSISPRHIGIGVNVPPLPPFQLEIFICDAFSSWPLRCGGYSRDPSSLVTPFAVRSSRNVYPFPAAAPDCLLVGIVGAGISQPRISCLLVGVLAGGVFRLIS